MQEINELDISILQFLKENGPSSIDSIKEAFQEIEAIEYRVTELSTPEYRSIPHARVPIPNTSYIVEDWERVRENGIMVTKPLGTYRLTDLGKKTLQDYISYSKSQRKDLWLKNAWIPILVSLATNLILGGLRRLWPLIQQWVSSIVP